MTAPTKALKLIGHLEVALGQILKSIMELSDILGWTATTLFTVCYIPQILKTRRTKTIDGLSFRLLFISFVANIIALYYATLIDQKPLQVKYVLALLFLSVCLYLYIRVYFENKQILKSN